MTKPFGLLDAIGNFALENKISLDSPEVIDLFLEYAKTQISEALKDAPLLHGTRVQNLFEATVLSLGGYQLLKVEDVGRVHSASNHRAPDFRVVLDDGTQWLIEVKNVRCDNPMRQRTRLTPNYLVSLKAYADLMGVPLRFAFYWSKWNLWSLVSPDQFQTADGGMVITMNKAMMVNEFGRLGDVNIGIAAPLRMVFDADPEKPHILHGNNEAEFTIKRVRFFSGETELTEKNEQNLAWILLSYGDWGNQGPHAIEVEGALSGIEFRAEPEVSSGQDFHLIGLASRIFSRYFAIVTTDGKRLVQFNGAPTPTWFAPLSQWDFNASKLKLWLLYQRPNDKQL